MDVKTILAAKGGSAFFVKSDSPVSEAIKLMNDKRIGAVLVREDEEGRLVAEQGSNALQLTVADVMTRDLVVCTSECTMDAIISGMTKFNVRHLPVLEDDKLLGLISARDVMRYRIRQLEAGHDPRFHRWFPKGRVYPLSK